MKHVLIYGQAGCGKTLNSAALAAAFGCDAICDGVSLPEFKALAANAEVKTLFLTTDISTFAVQIARRADVIPFGAAMMKVSFISSPWQPASALPGTSPGTELQVRLRGRRLGESRFVEVDGYYLDEFGLYYDDGCECFDTDEERIASGHDDNGCPHSGFYVVDDVEGDEAPYLPFAAEQWCLRIGR